MPKLPRVTAIKVIKALEKIGFVKVRQKGSHVIMKKSVTNGKDRQIGCVIPLHNKTIAVGTLKSILNQANISVAEFIENL